MGINTVTDIQENWVWISLGGGYVKRGAFAFFAAILFWSFGFSVSLGEDVYTEFPEKENVSSNKSWTLDFTKPVYFHGIDESDLYVVDHLGNVVEGTRIVYEHLNPYVLTIRPPEEGWQAGQAYTLFTSSDIISNEGEKLEKPVRMRFEIGHESGNVILALERSMSMPDFYRAFVETSNKSAKYYAVYDGNGDMLTNMKPAGEKAVFVLKDKDNTGVITVKMFSTYSELDLVESRDFSIAQD